MVIVTGGAKGIGQMYVRAFAKVGVRAVTADIDKAAAESLAVELARDGYDVMAKQVDVADQASCQSMAEEVWNRWRRLDVLVNNAAIYSTIERKPFTDITAVEWDQVMAVNLKGMLFCVQAVFPYMKQQGRGKIINVASSSVFKGSPNFLHYVTSKAGVIGFTRALAREVGEFGITLNAVAPGLTVSGSNQRVTPGDRFEKAVAERCLKRPELPEDVVGAVLFLASGYSDFITGQLLVVDGGGAMH